MIPAESRLLTGKVALITGAAGGVGAAIAHRFANEGATLVLVDKGTDAQGFGEDASRIESLAAELSEQQPVLALADDVYPPEGLVERALQAYGRLDVVVSAAGFSTERSLLRAEAGELEHVFRTHVHGPYELVRTVTKHMVDSKNPGSIVLVLGPVAFFGSARHSADAAAAAALVGLTRSAAVELRRHDIRINGLAVTARTRLTKERPTFQRIRSGAMEPEHVAPAAAFLASHLARDVHGEVLGVAGGRLYGFQTRETTGAFTDGTPMEPAEILDRWNEIVRG